MRCYKCGNIYNEYEGTLELYNKSIGNYHIYLKKYYRCAGCGTLQFPKETAKIIASKEEEIRNNLIRKLPIGDFIVASEAADILGITKQALHKHRRIKKGFIYSVTLSGKRLYNKKSVQIFKKTKDGRFNLAQQIDNEVVKYVTMPSTISHRNVFYAEGSYEPPHHSWMEKQTIIDNQNSRYIQ